MKEAAAVVAVGAAAAPELPPLTAVAVEVAAEMEVEVVAVTQVAVQGQAPLTHPHLQGGM